MLKTDLRKLLVLQGPAFEAKGILGFLRDHFEVHSVVEFDDALSAMRDDHFDAVLAETADFLPLERGVVTQQAAAVLNTIGDGVCIVEPGGQMVWANRKMREFSEPLLGELRRLCVEAYEEFASAGEAVQSRGRRFSLMPDDKSYYEVICSPVLDCHGKLRQVAAVAVNATSQRRQQQKFNAIDRAGRELVSLERDDVAQRDPYERVEMLEKLIVRCSRDVLKFEHFAVLLLDEKTNRLNVIMAEGLDDNAWRHEMFATPEGNGICGYVVATGRSYVCQDVAADGRYLTGLSGARSSLTVPLRLNDKIIGAINIESRLCGAFNEEDRQFAETFANYVALALNILNLLVSARHMAHTQLTGSICAELTGPLNDIITEITDVMEEYIGTDDLRRRLSLVVDQAAMVRRSIQHLGQSPASGVIPASAPPPRAEPVLAGKRILVADDEEPIRQTVHDILSPHGCRVDLAADGAEAIERICSVHYDLIVSDIKMPKANGYEVFRQVKARLGDVPVILITAFGYDPNHSIVRARQEGLSAVVLKPFKVKDLMDQVCAALSASAK